ncbi:MAG TPA: LysM domain-containing protein [Candidatus Limnocylindrales bacterium]|nr:LysM domain-containing protein [Candidatus Limnocylindrales bacterium]
MSRKALLLIGLLMLGGMLVAALPASAQTSVPVVTHVVQPNDTLSKIAARNCTTWQEIYNMNAAVIGPNPNILRAGTVLSVPNRCGTGTLPPGCTTFDRGPRQFAQGTVQGNTYTVAWGDTWFSVSGRFGTTQLALTTANGLPPNARLFANTRLIIPGLCGGVTPPPTQPIAGCTITVQPALTVFPGPNFNGAPIGVTRANGRYPVLGASVAGYGTSRWFPIGDFSIPGWINVFPGQFQLFGQCQG